MGSVVTALTVFGVVFVGELPDKTAVATLVLGARYQPLPVLAGVWAAFTVHVVVAVNAGGLIAGLPRRPVELVTAGLFLVGAVLLLRSDPDAAGQEGQANAGGVTGELSTVKVAAAAFGVVLVAEFGDLTQILTATLAARYNDPLPVGVGALGALWMVAGLAITCGQTLLRVVPLRRVQQFAALALLALAAVAAVSGLRG